MATNCPWRMGSHESSFALENGSASSSQLVPPFGKLRRLGGSLNYSMAGRFLNLVSVLILTMCFFTINFILVVRTVSASIKASSPTPLSKSEVEDLKEVSRDMFYHAYNAYMENAFPADELMPLSCKGRYRGNTNRGDIDDVLGNFSVTLIDALDTLVIMGDLDEFERGVKLVIDNVRFDHDITVSVFETNIRVIGGLLSAHILTELLVARSNRMSWYQGELLDMSLDVGYRLLPAFNSSTGLPHPRVNLRHGLKFGKSGPRSVGETCTACAGTMILEFAALSRLSGEPIFEEKASEAMDVLWASRHRMSNLVGNVLNIQTGDWVRRDSGVGAGIDSYYEYVAKAYVLLGEDKYLTRWHTHYAAIMKYLGQGPILQDVHMHRPHSVSKTFVDALGAFWPGLQVLMGDLRPAIESHEVLYQIMRRHNFIPEAFTFDFQVHWGQYLLRPEFVESTYFLYRATNDPHYLEVGKTVLESLQKHARVTCGYATIKDVRTMQKEDRMDSFVLSETFKYLYLLFANENDLVVDIEGFVFTTEGHLLPLTLARLSDRTAIPVSQENQQVVDEDVELARSCPSIGYLFPNYTEFARNVRLPLANLVADKSGDRIKQKNNLPRTLKASDFKTGNPRHMALIKNMGITLVSQQGSNTIQFLHTASDAKSLQHAQEGLLFIQEMTDLAKQESQIVYKLPNVVVFTVDDDSTREKRKTHRVISGPADFGKDLTDGFSVTAEVVMADPFEACKSVNNGNEFWGKIIIVGRGNCMFVEKGRLIESLGAKGGIVVDNIPDTTAEGNPLFHMSGDGTNDVSIPMVFLFNADSKTLLQAVKDELTLTVTLEELSSDKNVDANDDSEETGDYFDVTSISNFIESSKKQVEEYYFTVFSDTPSPSVERLEKEEDDHDIEKSERIEEKSSLLEKKKSRKDDIKGAVHKLLSKFSKTTKSTFKSLRESLISVGDNNSNNVNETVGHGAKDEL